MAWTPDPATPDLEQRMEDADLPESDRDEVRRFAEFLRTRKNRKPGEKLNLPPEMKEWLLGKD